MKILVYEDPHQMPCGHRSELSRVEFTKKEIAALPASEYRDFLIALSETSTPTIAHIRIKTGRDVILHQYGVQLVVTSIPEDDEKCSVIFGVGYNYDREGGDYLESHGLDPVPEKIASKYRDKVLGETKSLDGWRKYFDARFHSILNSSRAQADHPLHIASLCEPQ